MFNTRELSDEAWFTWYFLMPHGYFDSDFIDIHIIGENMAYLAYEMILRGDYS